MFPVKYIGVPIVMILIPYSMIMVRNKVYNGYISYGQTLVSGIIITLVYASLSAILIFLFLKFFDASIIDEFRNYSYEELEKTSSFFGDDMMDRMMEELEKMSPASVAMGEFFNKMIGGIIIALLAGIFVKRKPSPFES